MLGERRRRRDRYGCPGRDRVGGDRAVRWLLAVALVTGLGGVGAVTTALADAPRAPQRAVGPLAPGPTAPAPGPSGPASDPSGPALGGSVPASGLSVPALGRSVPTALDIPAIGVHADLVTLGLRPDGTVEVPAPDSPAAGWYQHSPTPGERGPAVLLGHVDSARTGPGVFYDLRMLRPGDAVRVGRADGSTAVFRVDAVERFPKAAFPTDAVYGDLDHAGLRLITCGGAFDAAGRSYLDNVVVFASAVGSA